MRSFVVSSLFVLFAAPLGAQARDSSFWTLGVSTGILQAPAGTPQRSERSAGSLQVEWRKVASRLAVRAEVSVAQSNRSYDPQETGCAGCTSDQRSNSVSALASLAYEWRQEQTLRPYVIAGAGLARDGYQQATNMRHTGAGFVREPTVRTTHGSRVGTVSAFGFGVSAHFGRASVFTEARSRVGGPGLAETLSFGVRVRPQ